MLEVLSRMGKRYRFFTASEGSFQNLGAAKRHHIPREDVEASLAHNWSF